VNDHLANNPIPPSAGRGSPRLQTSGRCAPSLTDHQRPQGGWRRAVARPRWPAGQPEVSRTATCAADSAGERRPSRNCCARRQHRDGYPCFAVCPPAIPLDVWICAEHPHPAAQSSARSLRGRASEAAWQPRPSCPWPADAGWPTPSCPPRSPQSPVACKRLLT